MERMVLESEECKQFWDETLRDCTPLVLPRWPSLVQTNGARMHHKPFQITGETLDGLKRLAKLAAVPMKDVLLSAHVKVMSLVSGQTDVLTGLSANNTRPEDVDGDEIRGLFINTLPLRMKLAEGTWVDLARETFEAERRMLPYRLYPLAVLQKKWGRQRLLETSFNYVHFHSVKTLFESGNVEIVGPGNGVELSSFTLQVNFSLNPMLSMLKMVLSCDGTQLYDEQVTAIADCYIKTLHAMAHHPHSSHAAFQPLEMAAETETSGVFVDLPQAVEFEDNFLF
jgi:non-ribosomal peptide synthetase component F